jgi:predicted nucleic acid-binding Zn ribbon protein
MPIWDMKCKKCGQLRPDYGLSGSEMVIQKCSCGGELEKMPPRVAVKFKGEGWSKPEAPEPAE